MNLKLKINWHKYYFVFKQLFNYRYFKSCLILFIQLKQIITFLNFKLINFFCIEKIINEKIFTSNFWACYFWKDLILKCCIGNSIKSISCKLVNIVQYKFIGEFFFTRKFFKYKQLQPRNSKLVVKKKKNRQINKLKFNLNQY